jgi:hypothetical protein
MLIPHPSAPMKKGPAVYGHSWRVCGGDRACWLRQHKSMLYQRFKRFRQLKFDIEGDFALARYEGQESQAKLTK